jgi:hypothetical protein
VSKKKALDPYFGVGTKRVEVTALYDAKNYRPEVLDTLVKPMFLS